TAELCPYPLLVNGAFSTDLSRQQIKISTDPCDYNAHLVRQAARLVREKLVPALMTSGPKAVLGALDRSTALVVAGAAAELLHTSLVDELADEPILPTELGTGLT